MLKKIAACVLAALVTLSLASCSGDTADSADASTQDILEISVNTNGVLDTSEIFSEEDLIQSVDTSSAKTYTLSSGSDISITRAGTYVIRGEAEDTQIYVKVNTGETVRIILDGVTIENEDKPCIYVLSGDKVVISTAEGTENTLSVTDAFADDETSNLDAVIFSKEDITINGHGTLNVYSPENGVTSKDDLKITGGTLVIDCDADALEAKDSVAIAGGEITVTTEKDGIHSEDSDNDEVGYVYICGGTVDIAAGDDGIHAMTVLQIDGGDINVEAAEGLEATYIQINGGTINLYGKDDGMNAASQSSAYTATLEINDGDITVETGSGDTDALDSNGNLYINGGSVDITAQSAFDYTSAGELNGGTVTVNGEEVTEMTNQFGGGMMGGGMRGAAPGDDQAEMTSEGEMPVMQDGDFTPMSAQAADTEETTDTETESSATVTEDETLSDTESDAGFGPGKNMNGDRPEPPSDGEMPEPPSGGEMPQMAEAPAGGEMPGNMEMASDASVYQTGTDYMPIIISAAVIVAVVIVAAVLNSRRQGFKKGDKR